MESTDKLTKLTTSARLQDTRSIYKNQPYFYTLVMNNLNKKIKKTILLIIVSKRTRYLEINLIREVQN